MIEVPATTVSGVWRGKDQHDWQHQRLNLDCRSPTLTPQLEGGLSIVKTFEDL